MGVYCKGEFKDIYGTLWRVEVQDTTYSGTIHTMLMQGEGFVREYESLKGESLMLDKQLMSSSVTATIQVRPTDTAILALIDDLPNGGEDQFYLLIYKDDVMSWAGMLLTDICEYHDLYNFGFTFRATCGLKRLEQFDADIATDIATPIFVTELDIIIDLLSICGTARFFGTGDFYIASNIQWREINQPTSLYDSLFFTRLCKYSMLEDLEENRPKKAAKVLMDILESYGAHIRFENGMWRICQLETFTTNATNWQYYTKLLAITDKDSENKDVTINTGSNKVKSIITRTWLNSIAAVGITSQQQSWRRWGVNEQKFVFTTPKHIQETIPVIPNDLPYQLYVNIFYLSAFINPPGSFFQHIIVVQNGDFWYVGGYMTNIPGGQSAIASGTIFVPLLQWVYSPGVDPSTLGYRHAWHEQFITTRGEYTMEYVFQIISPPDITQPLIITTYLLGITNGLIMPYTSREHKLYQLYDNGKPELEDSFIANNTVYNSSSFWIEKTTTYCDANRDLVIAAKQIYDDATSSWINSSEWDDGSNTLDYPILKLLALKAIKFQRYPRAMVVGSIFLTDYCSYNTIVWRGVRYMFLGGSFSARSGVWQGEWVQVVEQSTNIVVATRNPWRNEVTISLDNGGDNYRLGTQNTSNIQKLNLDMAEAQQSIQQLQNKTAFGVDGFLLQNIEGLDGMGTGEKKYLVAEVSEAGELKLKFIS